MAILLYGNGLTEELIPNNLTFSDEEILEIFSDYSSIETKRLEEIPNTWCVWGVNPDNKEEDYNKLGSDVIQEHCYSHLAILHDTEVDPSWNLTDSVIYDGYAQFKMKILLFLDEIAREAIKDIEKMREENGNKGRTLMLDQIAISTDKRVIFKLDLNKQIPGFFDKDNFTEFAIKCESFISESYKDGDIFPVFADKKMIIVLEDPQVKTFIDSLIKIFQDTEEFEKCSKIRNIYNQWVDYKEKKNKPKKRGRPKKKKEDDPQ